MRFHYALQPLLTHALKRERAARRAHGGTVATLDLAIRELVALERFARMLATRLRECGEGWLRREVDGGLARLDATRLARQSEVEAARESRRRRPRRARDRGPAPDAARTASCAPPRTPPPRA